MTNPVNFDSDVGFDDTEKFVSFEGSDSFLDSSFDGGKEENDS